MDDLGCRVVWGKELWLCANGRFRMQSGMRQGIVVMREWKDLGCSVIYGARNCGYAPIDDFGCTVNHVLCCHCYALIN